MIVGPQKEIFAQPKLKLKIWQTPLPRHPPTIRGRIPFLAIVIFSIRLLPLAGGSRQQTLEVADGNAALKKFLQSHPDVVDTYFPYKEDVEEYDRYRNLSRALKTTSLAYSSTHVALTVPTAEMMTSLWGTTAASADSAKVNIHSALEHVIGSPTATRMALPSALMNLSTMLILSTSMGMR